MLFLASSSNYFIELLDVLKAIMVFYNHLLQISALDLGSYFTVKEGSNDLSITSFQRHLLVELECCHEGYSVCTHVYGKRNINYATDQKMFFVNSIMPKFEESCLVVLNCKGTSLVKQRHFLLLFSLFERH